MDGPVLRLFRLVNPQEHSLFTHGDPCGHPILPQCERFGRYFLRFMWLTIVLSFVFYIPVVLWVDLHPFISMLMIPKTCAYVWTVFMGYVDMRKHDRMRRKKSA